LSHQHGSRRNDDFGAGDREWNLAQERGRSGHRGDYEEYLPAGRSTDTDAHADGYTNRDADGDADRHSDGDADEHADGDADEHADRHADGDPDGDADEHADGDPDEHADGDPDRHSDGDPDGDGDVECNCDAHPSADSGCGFSGSTQRDAHDRDVGAGGTVDFTPGCGG